jgi:hypothetical protein
VAWLNSGASTMTIAFVSEEIRCRIALLATVEGRRSSSQECRYRPNHRDPVDGSFFLGQIGFLEGTVIEPGQVKEGIVRVLTSSNRIQALKDFGSWTFWEGPNVMAGSVTVTVVGQVSGDMP